MPQGSDGLDKNEPVKTKGKSKTLTRNRAGTGQLNFQSTTKKSAEFRTWFRGAHTAFRGHHDVCRNAHAGARRFR